MARRRYGSVRRLPSGRWQARYWDGAEQRPAPATFPTKADAQRWLSAAETDMGRGDWHDPHAGAVPLAEWAQQWLAAKEPKLASSTVDLYGYLLRRHILPRFASTDVGRIAPTDVQSWVAGLHQSDLSPNTVAKAYRLLSGIMDGAVGARLIARTPCTLKGAGTERQEEMKVATPEQIYALADAVGPRWEALVFTAAYSGLRWGELAGLRRCDVDLETATISVVRKLAEVNGALSFNAPKSAAGRRKVGIPSFVSRSLDAHISLYATPGADGLVFPALDGGPMRRSNFRRRVWTPATTQADMAGFRFHDLRHTAATLAAASGASLKMVMARIGHASPAAALRYQHVVEGQDDAIVDFLERFGEPGVSATDRQDTSRSGTQQARRPEAARSEAPEIASDQDPRSGADGNRTHDPLLAKQVLHFPDIGSDLGLCGYTRTRLPASRPLPVVRMTPLKLSGAKGSASAATVHAGGMAATKEAITKQHMMMTAADVAHRLGISASSARRRLAEADAPASIRISPRLVRWDATEIETWISTLRETHRTDLRTVHSNLGPARRRGPKAARQNVEAA